MVHQCQKTGDCASPEVKKTAKSIDFDDADKFASTKHKGLPEHKKPKKKKKVEEMAAELGRYPTFAEFVGVREGAGDTSPAAMPSGTNVEVFKLKNSVRDAVMQIYGTLQDMGVNTEQEPLRGQLLQLIRLT